MPEQINRFTYGEIIDYLYGYELREARANNRARMIMAAFCGEDPTKFWPLFTDEQHEETEVEEEQQGSDQLKKLALLLGAI